MTNPQNWYALKILPLNFEVVANLIITSSLGHSISHRIFLGRWHTGNKTCEFSVCTNCTKKTIFSSAYNNKI